MKLPGILARKRRLTDFAQFEEPIRAELFSAERLEQHARSLALAQVVSPDRARDRPQVPRVRRNGEVLQEAHAKIGQAARQRLAITPAAEWLLDNFHVVEDQLRDIRRHLPAAYYRRLPKLAQGPLRGYPRVYGLAWAVVAHTDSRFDADWLVRFVRAYQGVQPLTIGELWAVPTSLRIVMIENLRRLAVRIVGSQIARQGADRFVDELPPGELGAGPADLLRRASASLGSAALWPAFAVQLVQRLRYRAAGTTALLEWLHRETAAEDPSTGEIVHAEHSSQAAANLTVRNLITSMREISSFDWRVFFEEVSLVDQTLRGCADYCTMDFKTRDAYRHAIEDLARGSSRSEVEVAAAALGSANRARSAAVASGRTAEPRTVDPGYYLFAGGRRALERELAYQPGPRRRCLRACRAHATAVYLGAIGLTTIVVAALPVLASRAAGVLPAGTLLLGCLCLLPASDIAIALVHRLTTRLFRPRSLPRLSLAGGIPASMATFVVMPTMLSSHGQIAEHIERLEMHFLSNRDDQVRFALLTDWLDADSEAVATDGELLDLARAGVDALNDRHPQAAGGDAGTTGARFFLLHRRRRWNPSEGLWMGWERKRGKLHEFNRLLRGATDTSYLGAGTQGLPGGVRYVVTVDADTRLPIGAVRRLVGTAAHPLNRPFWDAPSRRVTRGYGVLQPRVMPTFPAVGENTIYQRLFSGPPGLDRYAAAASDVYQDLFGEGSYTGKGLYDIDLFEQSLAGRVPENSVLSHDLFEGIFARCGLASDIEFFDEFPSSAQFAAARQHRWARGDWQLLPWICGRAARGISVINRWKMIDNLRRTLSPVACVALLLVSWSSPGARQWAWSGLVLAAIALPGVLALLDGLRPPPGDVSVRSHLRALATEAWHACLHAGVTLVALVHQAWQMLDAIGLTLERLFVSRRSRLVWVTAAESRAACDLSLARAVWPPRLEVALVSALAALGLVRNPDALAYALPVLALWWSAPLVLRHISLPPAPHAAQPPSPAEVLLLRRSARRIWLYFTTFVTAADHALPPDNFQEDPEPVVAHRTSPTNIGLYLLACTAARDFGWIGLGELGGRLAATTDTLLALPRHRGHWFNWYETRELRPLDPRYVSTVDSGNLAGHLLAVAQACDEGVDQSLFTGESLRGLMDTLGLARATLDLVRDDRRTLIVNRDQVAAVLADTARLLEGAPADFSGWVRRWEGLRRQATLLSDISAALAAERGTGDHQEALLWSAQFLADVASHAGEVEDLIGPYGPLQGAASGAGEGAARSLVLGALDRHLRADASLAEIGRRLPAVLADLAACHPPHASIEAVRHWAAARAADAARLAELAARARHLAMAMDFGFLFDANRQLFHIGFHAAEASVDEGHYDLLASESRLASYIAIAKGDVPAAHWFHLGRATASIRHRPVLLSWSGSMFEYLMPSLVLDTPGGTLLEETCRRVVERQVQYGAENGIPWGISESAYNLRDRAFTYQYSDFGVPGLGLKRGLGDNLVVAPYATAMASMVDAPAALRNLARLRSEGGLGRFGPYDAIDYTPARLADGQRAAVVRTFMAHHQGISLAAFDNALNDGVLRRRFHREPLVRAAELLLQERPPRSPDERRPRIEQLPATPARDAARPALRTIDSPHSAVPVAHLLSNGRYVVMLTAAGSGYSQCGRRFITRWREDPTADCWGSYLFLRDLADGAIWSATYQPTVVEPDAYSVVFAEDRARILRHDGTLASVLEIIVSPEDDAEVRRLSITNHGLRPREIEVTSYAELVLADPAADAAHPAYSNLFVQTEHLPEAGGLLASRRPRSADEAGCWAAHVLAAGPDGATGVEYETDRARFLGRGRTVRAPAAMLDHQPLSNTVGPVLDPVFSLRARVRLAPGATARLVFSTMVASSRQELVDLADKYHDASIFERISTLAFTHAQVQLHHLGIDADDALLYQALAGRILFSSVAVRPTAEVLARNTLGASGLWAHGISGDRPLVLLGIDSVEQRGIVSQLLRAHEYWQMKGLAVDLVLLNTKASSYFQDLQRMLEDMARSSRAAMGQDSPGLLGRVFVLRADALAAPQLLLLETFARVVLVGALGGLAEQLAVALRADEPAGPAPRLGPQRHAAAAQSTRLPPLEFFNGLGGFADNGREYIIVLGTGQHTPAPWINVVANPDFGFQVSESGAGYTWSVNSRENQLTPWSNDPVCDPAGEALYLRDEESGEFWTPTAAPIRIEQATYIARHGQGRSRFQTEYGGIASDWLQCVAWADPVKLSRLILNNRSPRTRTLTVTAYVDWVLGAGRAANAHHVVTEQDGPTGALFARNPLNSDFGGRVAFADLGGRQASFTCDRTEFLGRHGALDRPAAVVSALPLAGRFGAGLDPCGALRTTVVLLPGQQATLLHVLGQARDREAARELVLRYRTRDFDAVLGEVEGHWDRLLGTVQVETPDRPMDLMVNRWLLYQTIACRLWARAAFYQAGGAWGFRDQLQDTMALAATLPSATRDHLLRAAARQFVEGDVQHWWHPPSGRGVRTLCSDDLVWLPFATAHYVEVTGDTAVLDEELAFLEGPPLAPGQADAYFTPTVSPHRATLFEHCARALERSLAVGPHGLPLIGTGDWNDGMNRVGHRGRGESVWLGWFLCATLRRFALLAEQRGGAELAARWRAHVQGLQAAAEVQAWDGAWYRRAYFDDGTPLGTAAGAECRIDSIAQSWAVLSGAADATRARRAMDGVDAHLVRPGDDLVLLLTPPFDRTALDPGYIKGYPPGVRENGGQYTHAATWYVMARALLGDGQRAVELFAMLNPVNRTASRAGVHAYKVEPYVVAADVYAEPPHARRGGWTWYTGSAGWLHRAALEGILGVTKRGDVLHVAPCIPATWNNFRIRWRHGAAEYVISVENTRGVARGVERIEVDGAPLASPELGIALRDDARVHEVRVVMG